MTRLEELFLRWQEQDLSVQELEEFERLLDNPEARALIRDDFLTTNTIETHLRHVFQKLGVRSRTEFASKFTDFRDSTAAPAA